MVTDHKRAQAAERQRRYRARRKAGLIVVPRVEVGDADFCVALADEGLLDPQCDDDPEAVRAAFRALISRWVGRNA